MSVFCWREFLIIVPLCLNLFGGAVLCMVGPRLTRKSCCDVHISVVLKVFSVDSIGTRMH